MAFTIPYSTETVRVPNFLIKGNETADAPVEFDIAPAWGADMARIKSVVVASAGLSSDEEWSPGVQNAVIKAFETGGSAFVNTVLAIRNLSIPMRMAIRAGIISAPAAGAAVDTPVPIVNGEQFSRIAGAIAGQAFWLAMKIVHLSGKQEIDPRFFVQPSGSGGQGTSGRRTTTAGSAPKTSRRRGTAGSQEKTESH